MPLTKATQNVVEGIVSTGSTGVSAGSFIVGQQYKITALGSTDWNTAAGTVGQTYVVGSLFTAANAGLGSGAAAVARTLANRFNDVVNVLDFGVVGDGASDDTINIKSAIEYCSTNKKRLYIPGGKTYLMTGITINAPYYVDMFSDPANRAVFKTTQAAAQANAKQFEFLDSTDQISGRSITQNIIPNQRKIYLNSVSLLTEGMIIRITSNVLWPYDARGCFKGEIHLITEVNSVDNSVTIEDSTRDTYLTTNIITVAAWQPNKFAIENLEFEIPEVNPTSTTGDTGGVLFDKTYNALILNCKVSGINNYGFTNRFCVNTSYQKIQCAKTQNTSLGYGIVDRTSLGTHITDLTSYRLRAAYDSSDTNEKGPNRDAVVDGFVIRGGGVYYPDGVTIANRGLGMHGPSENVQFINGYISDVANGIRVRGKNTFIRNITFSGLMITGVACSHGTLMTVSDCTYDSVNYPNKNIVIPTGVVPESRLTDFINFGISDSAANNWNFELPVMVHNNIIAGLKQSVVNIESPGEVSNLFLNNNIIQATPDADDTTLVFYTAASNRAVYNSTCIGNQLSALSGDIALVDSKVLLGYSADPSIKERAVAIDNRSWLIRLKKNTVGKIRTGASDKEQQERLNFILTGDSGGTKSFLLWKQSTDITNWYGTSFTALKTTDKPNLLTGETGADGDVTIGVMDNGDFYIEDRLTGFSGRTWRVTLLA
jgi:hypothetical protein